jgi:type VII secretion-associated serine protease mycosin
MRLRFTAAAGAVVLAAVVTIPATPARADSFRNDQWFLKALKISEAQAISKGSGVTVAVIDSGVYPHPDLKRNLLPGTSVLADGGSPHSDQAGHGTQMAALIAAHGRNESDGVLGVAPAAKILPVKIMKSINTDDSSPLTSGVKWAADQGAKVINVSVGVGPTSDLVDAVGTALDSNIVVVAGVGNRNAAIYYPAAINGVLAVGATDRNGHLASFSFKDPKVQICAPGVDITTAEPKNKYVDVDGTSPATAIVSGAAALVRAKFPQMSADDVVKRLTSTADDIGPPGRDNECGFGELNIVKALTAPLEGGAASSAASGPATTAPVTTAPTAVAGGESESEPASSGTPAILAVAAVLVIGGLVAALVIRRRRRGF